MWDQNKLSEREIQHATFRIREDAWNWSTRSFGMALTAAHVDKASCGGDRVWHRQRARHGRSFEKKIHFIELAKCVLRFVWSFPCAAASFYACPRFGRARLLQSWPPQ